MRRTLAVLVSLAALGAACGEEEPIRETGATTAEASGDLAEVEVTLADGEAPTITFDQPFSASETETRVLVEGDGDTIAENTVVEFDFLFVNGRDGSVVSSSYDTEPASVVFEDSLMPAIFEGMSGLTAGSQVIIAIAPGDGAGADEASGLTDTDTVLFFADILSVRVPLTRAEGTAVEPAADLPTVVLGEDGAPSITIPDGVDAPAELVAQPLIEGDGAVVESGQSITVHYTGVLYKDGSGFDSSWERGAPTSFDIGTGAVIPGWDEGLVGRTIGSQILLVVPADKGYGEDGSPDGSIGPGEVLVFVVDILDAQ